MLLGALALGTPAFPLRAQSLGGGAMGYVVTRRVSYQGAVRQQTGMWVGVEGSVRLGMVTVGASGFFGKMAGDSAPATNPDLDMRVSNVWGRFNAAPWVDLGVILEARRQASAVGVTTWRLIGPMVRLTPSLGVSGLEGSAEVAYFASASVVGGEAISPALRATLGARYTPPGGHLEFAVGYRLERFDFAAMAGNPARLEQFSGIVAGASVRLGRRR
jgi:hypothetical protein